MKRRLFVYFAALGMGVLALGLIGCSTSSNSVAFGRADNALLAASGQSSPILDFYLSSQSTSIFLSGVQPNSSSNGITNYITTRAGTGVNLFVDYTGGTTQVVSPTPQIDLNTGQYYTIFVIGALPNNGAQPNNAPAPQVVRLTDVYPSGLPASAAYVRIFHAAPNTLTGKLIDIYEQPTSGNTTVVPGWQSIGYGIASGGPNTTGATTNGYIAVTPSVAHTYQVRDHDDTTTVATFTIPANTLAAGDAYTLAVTGSTDAALNSGIGYKLFTDYPRQ